MQNAKHSRGYAAANKNLQMDEWAYKEYFAAAIIDETTGKTMENRDLMKKPDLKALWEHSLATELGKLTQGIRDIKGTTTIYFTPKSDIPHNRRKEITYSWIVVKCKPDKLEKHRTRLRLITTVVMTGDE